MSASATQTSPAADLRRAAIGFVLRGLGFIVLSAAMLFGISGNWRWLSAWAYLAVMFANTVVSALTLPKELLNERSSVKQDAKKWDKRIVLAFMLIGVAVQVAAALDARYAWSPRMPALIKGAALGVFIASTALVYWAMRSNRFFSPVVRIQTERGHVVATGGPYAYVRHPGYVGIILNFFAVPLLLGSRIAFLIGVAGNVLFVVRTALEDRTLQCELPGYPEYAQRVRYRLLPGLW